MNNYNLLAWWKITDFCNFNCSYCSQLYQNKPRSNFRTINIEKALKFFDETKKTWLVYFYGGEPFLHPNFIELCQELTKKHYLSIDTNLSSRQVNDFCKKINPKKVKFITCSLHILEREKLNLTKDFIDKVKALKKAGFNVIVTQVMWPPIIERFDNILDYLNKQNIAISPFAFIGTYKNKFYPDSYTKKERKKIFSYIKNFVQKEKVNVDKNEMINVSVFVDYIKFLVKGNFSFKNSMCTSGFKSIRIKSDGNITRCDSDSQPLGNIHQDELKLFEKPQSCTNQNCFCPFEGFLFSKNISNTIKGPKSYNILNKKLVRLISRTKEI